MKRLSFLVLLSGFIPWLVLANEPFVFLSTQLKPIEEAEKVRKNVLKQFPEEVNFQPIDDRPLFYHLATEVVVEGYRPGLLAAAHSEFTTLLANNGIRPLDGLLPKTSLNRISPRFLQLGKLGKPEQYFIPWMQGTYLMVANRLALPYLPKKAKLDQLSYEQLVTWAANIQKATGKAKLGYPVGEHGLMHRFLEGYMYPSFTGAMIQKFHSKEAVLMWENLRMQWRYVNPLSLAFDSMSEPLISDEVWIAWDHTARLLPVFKKAPEKFVAFPAPIGPKGRGYIFVLAGLAVPKMSTDADKAIRLIDYLIQPNSQQIILEQFGFFPVLSLNENIVTKDKGLGQLADAVTAQGNSESGIPFPLPVGLGERSHEFNLAYLLAFSHIVLRQRDIQSVLQEQSAKLGSLTRSVEAPCWSPKFLSFISCEDL